MDIQSSCLTIREKKKKFFITKIDSTSIADSVLKKTQEGDKNGEGPCFQSRIPPENKCELTCNYACLNRLSGVRIMNACTVIPQIERHNHSSLIHRE